MTDGRPEPADLAHIYHRTTSGRTHPLNSPAISSDSTIVTTMPSSGAVAAKPARKRSRASRRAPTTLLNTDTSNFRAMVQQFTGVPSVPYTTSYVPRGAPPTISFGMGFNSPVNQTTMSLPSFGLHQQQTLSTLPSQYNNLMPPQQQQETMMDFVMHGNMEDEILRGLNSTSVAGRSEEFFLDGMAGVLLPPAAEHGRDDGYFL